MPMKHLHELAGLLEKVGRPGTDLGQVEIRGADPVLSKLRRVGAAAAIALAGCGDLAADC